MRETWYVLEDGTLADPNEVGPDDAGILRHAGGLMVAMRGNVPMSRGVDDADAERSKIDDQRKARDAAKDMKPEEPKRGYKTRESKAG